MMLGFLLARAGVPVTVLEKHADFLRDFRGDTVHPSTLEMMHELGLLDEFLKLPHSEVRQITMQIGDDRVTIGDFDTAAGAVQVHRADAAMGFPEFSGEARQALPDLRSAHAGRGDRSDRGGRPRRRACAPRRRTANWRSAPIWWSAATAAIRRARARRLRGGRSGRADGRDVVSPVAQDTAMTSETFGHIEAGRMMVMLNRERLLAMRLCHPQGQRRRGQAQGPRRLSRKPSATCRRSCATGSTKSATGTR